MKRAHVFAKLALATLAMAFRFDAAQSQNAPPNCAQMRPLQLGAPAAPPAVVHTTPYIAKELGFFARRCIDASILAFDGGQSPAAIAAVSQGKILSAITDVPIGRGMKAHQIWGITPRLPHAYVVNDAIKTLADLKGKRLSAAGGGVGGFTWQMGRAVLAHAGLGVSDAQFIPIPGKVTSLAARQIDGMSFQPEDVYVAIRQVPGAHVLAAMADVMPDFMYNPYGASDEFIARDRGVLVDAVAAMIEANRTIYRDKEKVIPIMVTATGKPREEVEYARDVLTQNCVFGINAGFSRARTEWTVNNSVQMGDIAADKKPAYEQVVDESIANHAVTKVGGPISIGNCKF